MIPLEPRVARFLGEKVDINEEKTRKYIYRHPNHQISCHFFLLREMKVIKITKIINQCTRAEEKNPELTMRIIQIIDLFWL